MGYIKTLPLPFSTAPATAGQRRMHSDPGKSGASMANLPATCFTGN